MRKIDWINSKISANYFQVFAILFVILLYIPYLFLQETSFIGTPFDFLNSNVVWIKIISENNMAFVENCSKVYPNILDQPRVALGSEFTFIFVLYKIFPVFWALIINSFFITITGFFSFHRLLSYLKINLNSFYKTLFSFCFALLPFWQFGGISIAGFPLVFVILHQIYKGEKLNIFTISFLIFYAFYSNFFIFNIFLYFSSIVYFGISTIIQKKLKPAVFLVLGFLIVLGLSFEYRLIYFALEPCFTSNRTALYGNMKTGFGLLTTLFRYSNQHAPPLHFPFIVSFLFVTIIALRKKILLDKTFLIIVLIIVLGEVLSANIVAILINDYLKISFLKGFSFHRFNMVNQITWYFLFAYLTSKMLQEKRKWLHWIPVVFLIAQFGFILLNNIPSKNLRSAIQPENYKYNIRFSDYYMLDEYRQIDQLLPSDKTSYKVIHYGFDPATSSYQGYSTVDGFLPVYDQKEENKFDETILPLLSQDNKKYQKKPYHNYVVTENYAAGKNYLQNYSKSPLELKLNFGILEKLDASYLFSTVPLTNSQFALLGKVSSKYWQNIYIYKINYH